MIVLDVSVLLAAYRADHPHHGTVRPWFDEWLSAGESFAAPDVVWVGFVRVATNSRTFPVPSSIPDAFAFVDAVTAQPAYVQIPGASAGLDRFRSLCVEASATGNLVPDA